MKILLTNDDGITSAGLIALADHLKRDHQLCVVAPDNERSGVSHSITYRRPIFHKSVPVSDGLRGFAINGYPVDCVKVAMFELCPFKPDLVVSGINHGLNVGLNVLHSGTVAAALTGATYGLPAIALSLEEVDGVDELDFVTAVQLAWPICQRAVEANDLRGTVLNINVPRRAVEQNADDYEVVPVNCNNMGFHFELGTDPKRRRYHWQTNHPVPEPLIHPCDVHVVAAGRISVSPLGFDLTRQPLLAQLASQRAKQPTMAHVNGEPGK